MYHCVCVLAQTFGILLMDNKSIPLLKYFWLGLITHSFASSQQQLLALGLKIMTGTNYDGTPCIIKKYKSAKKRHWNWKLSYISSLVKFQGVVATATAEYFWYYTIFISHKSHKCLADFSQSFIIGMAAKLPHKNVAKNTKSYCHYLLQEVLFNFCCT